MRTSMSISLYVSMECLSYAGVHEHIGQLACNATRSLSNASSLSFRRRFFAQKLRILPVVFASDPVEVYSARDAAGDMSGLGANCSRPSLKYRAGGSRESSIS